MTQRETDKTVREIPIDQDDMQDDMPDMDAYSNCRFAVEIVNYAVIAFKPEFQRELYEKYKEIHGLSDADIRDILQGMNWEENEYDWLPGYDEGEPDDFDPDEDDPDEDESDEGESEEDGDGSVPKWEVMQVMRAIGAYFKGDVLTFQNKDKFLENENGAELLEVLGDIGYECDFEGQSSRHLCFGVEFIE